MGVLFNCGIGRVNTTYMQFIDKSNAVFIGSLIFSRVGATYKTGFGLDDWIYCTLYTQLGTRGNTALSILHISTSPLHTQGFLSPHWSYPVNGFITVSL
jgi:hypothetical protein